MKKIKFAVLAVAGLATALVSCNTTGTSSDDNVLKITMLTDVGTIDDKNFNQGTWEGLKAWCSAKGLKEDTNYSYLRPEAADTTHYEAAIDDAVDGGADVIVCPGYLFQEAFEAKAVQYPNVAFVGLDFTQNNIAETKNSVNITFKENEAGFLAGYAAVAEGIEKLGFMGGIFGDAVAKYGIGFAAGVAYANKQLNGNSALSKDNVWYCGSFAPGEDIQNTISGWYTTGGVDTVFAAAGGAGKSVLNAAKSYNSSHAEAHKNIIGVDIDQSGDDPLYLTSAMKGLAAAVGDALDNIVNSDLTGINESFSMGGKSSLLGAKEDAVALPTSDDAWRFTKFTKDQYQTIFAKVKNGEITIPSYSKGAGEDSAQLKQFFKDYGKGVADDVADYLYAGK